MNKEYIYHHGIQGQKWGQRRYQNPDGTLTEEGKERYSSGKERRNTRREQRKDVVNTYKKAAKSGAVAIGRTSKKVVKSTVVPAAKKVGKSVSEAYNGVKTGDPRYKRAMAVGLAILAAANDISDKMAEDTNKKKG